MITSVFHAVFSFCRLFFLPSGSLAAFEVLRLDDDGGSV
jgi:hypothetical protein